ncbi:YceH family protein [Oceanisphaera sp. W20_SRM_FM3]|uniref:YceH family protein n=1 Tax=Oceanisphaera sp. W20_SRM_FM3 TaxID=3240267 RepID=UPI003F9BFCCC
MEMLSLLEQRVIGCLIEKQVSTPEVYPLTLKSLLNACNQKSNRQPVMSITEAELQVALDSLSARHLVNNCADFNARTAKYQHRFCNTEFGDLQFNDAELAIICELLLRGPQTMGELRSRTPRLHAFNDVSSVEASMQSLISQGPYVVKLAKLPGKRDARFAHLFADVDYEQYVETGNEKDNQALFEQVNELKAHILELQARIQELEQE